MEIQRKIYNRISDWKNETNGKKALLVEGARRIGKSTVVEEFAQKEYKSYILIDFKTKFRISHIEVRSAKNYTATSLESFKEIYKKRLDRQIIVHPKNYSEEDGIIKIPPYMMFLI